jgi:hypothetical protein
MNGYTTYLKTNQWIIKIDDGYYSEDHPWTIVTIDKATTLDTKQANKLARHLRKLGYETIMERL